MAVSRRNSALKFYLNGRRAKDLHGLTDAAGKVLSAFDDATTKAMSGLKRRAAPAAVRCVRENYNVKSGTLRPSFRVESGMRGRRGDRDDFISIWASTRQLSLIEFSGRWNGPARRKSGSFAPSASAQITTGGRKTYDGAFIATIKGRRAIRVRQYVSGTGRRHGRGPLRMLRGPSPFEMLSGVDHAPSRQARDAVLTELTDFYSSELRRLWALERGRRG